MREICKVLSVFSQLSGSNGFVSITDLLEPSVLQRYQQLYSQFLDGKIDARKHRHDLGSHEEQRSKDNENVCQIMWPSEYVSLFKVGLVCSCNDQAPLHERTLALSKALLGDDMTFDFDMLIFKVSHINKSQTLTRRRRTLTRKCRGIRTRRTGLTCRINEPCRFG